MGNCLPKRPVSYDREPGFDATDVVSPTGNTTLNSPDSSGLTSEYSHSTLGKAKIPKAEEYRHVGALVDEPDDLRYSRNRDSDDHGTDSHPIHVIPHTLDTRFFQYVRFLSCFCIGNDHLLILDPRLRFFSRDENSSGQSQYNKGRNENANGRMLSDSTLGEQ